MVEIMSDKKRLIEVAFPLKQTSIDSVHEKMVHAGHPKALHIWPARRPLAACRAALIATLLPDPEDNEERKLILEKLGGRLVQRVKKVKDADGKVEEKIVEETEGGILHWGRESDPDLEWFRQMIREAYGGRAPKVLDPFAGGGAIPLETMRLGCEATAVDINPVAWFIQKCTLEYPQKIANQPQRRLPDFILEHRDFIEFYLKENGFSGQALAAQLKLLGFEKETVQRLPGMEAESISFDANLAWHIRAWGRWIHDRLQSEVGAYYARTDEVKIVGYLWARTVKCTNCRVMIPMIKSKWLSTKKKNRVLLSLVPDPVESIVFCKLLYEEDIQKLTLGGKVDKNNSSGTMTRSGVVCPCCGSITSYETIRLEGKSGSIGSLLIAKVISTSDGKRLIDANENDVILSQIPDEAIESVFRSVPFGLPEEATPGPAGSKFNSSSLRIYGIDRWADVFTRRQLLVLGTLVNLIREVEQSLHSYSYSSYEIEAIVAYLACVFGKVADYNSSLVAWQPRGMKGSNTFVRWALSMKWDFVENNIIESESGGWNSITDWVTTPLLESLNDAMEVASSPTIINQSALDVQGEFDLILTDPPYYDAIPYSDLTDFFYVWLKRILFNYPGFENKFNSSLAPKWDHTKNDGELIDNPVWFNGDKLKSKSTYEDGMFRAFQTCLKSLVDNGRFVVVFAHKNPDAWETLVSAIIRAGFIVDSSWPIQTEMSNRTRALSSAALASSVWLVCKKRPEITRPGWDNRVLEEMRKNITTRLRDFWDAGIRGPDFVWAATGPALEAYSQYPAVKKANEPGKLMMVGEFLRQVRRMVVDFVVGRVLTLTPDPSPASGEGSQVDVSGLDDITTYYLLHRHDFGFEEAPAGACILYAISCGLSDRDLADRYDLLTSSGKPRPKSEDAEIEEDGNQEAEYEESSGSTLRLKGWKERKSPSLGMDPVLDKSSSRLPMFPDMEIQAAPSRSLPLIDQVHRLMHLWKAGDVNKVNDYLDIRGLRRNQLFHQLLQALIELAPTGSEERALLESISNHVVGRGQTTLRLF